jgi:hypothetical protein
MCRRTCFCGALQRIIAVNIDKEVGAGLVEIDNKDKEMHGMNNGNDEPVYAVIVQIKNIVKPRTSLLVCFFL